MHEIFLLTFGGGFCVVLGIGVLKLYMHYKIGFYVTPGVAISLCPPKPEKGENIKNILIVNCVPREVSSSSACLSPIVPEKSTKNLPIKFRILPNAV